MSTPFRFGDLPAELRDRVYRFMYPNVGLCIDTYTTLPSLAYVPDLRADFLPSCVDQHSFDLDLWTHDDRKRTACHLADFDHSIVRNATEIHIYVNDDGKDFDRNQDAALRFALGGRSVDWSTPSAGAARKGLVHVVFDSLRGSMPESRDHALEITASSDKWRLHNTEVAKTMVAAINSIVFSHGPHLSLRITARELRKMICLLDDIHGIKLNGFGKRLPYRHMNTGAVADFWNMVERE